MTTDRVCVFVSHSGRAHRAPASTVRSVSLPLAAGQLRRDQRWKAWEPTHWRSCAFLLRKKPDVWLLSRLKSQKVSHIPHELISRLKWSCWGVSALAFHPSAVEGLFLDPTLVSSAGTVFHVKPDKISRCASLQKTICRRASRTEETNPLALLQQQFILFSSQNCG